MENELTTKRTFCSLSIFRCCITTAITRSTIWTVARLGRKAPRFLICQKTTIVIWLIYPRCKPVLAQLLLLQRPQQRPKWLFHRLCRTLNCHNFPSWPRWMQLRLCSLSNGTHSIGNAFDRRRQHRPVFFSATPICWPIALANFIRVQCHMYSSIIISASIFIHGIRIWAFSRANKLFLVHGKVPVRRHWCIIFCKQAERTPAAPPAAVPWILAPINITKRKHIYFISTTIIRDRINIYQNVSDLRHNGLSILRLVLDYIPAYGVAYAFNYYIQSNKQCDDLHKSIHIFLASQTNLVSSSNQEQKVRLI